MTVFRHKWRWGIALAVACGVIALLLGASAASPNQIIYVYSDSCGYCTSFEPTFEKVSAAFVQEHSGWAIERLDVMQDDQFAIASELGAVVTPTVFVVREGVVVDKWEGDVPEHSFLSFLTRNVTASK